MSQAAITRRGAVGWTAVILACLGSPTLAPAAPARERDPGSAAGQTALAEKQYERARTLFAEAYLQSGNRALLCRVAEAELLTGRATPAADLWNRCLEAEQLDPAQRQAAQAALLRSRGQAVECTVQSRQGLSLSVDGRPVAVTQLFEHVLLAPGPHRLAVPGDCAGVACELDVKVEPGHELRVTLKPGELPSQRRLTAVVLPGRDLQNLDNLARRAPETAPAPADTPALGPKLERTLREGLRTRDAQLLPLTADAPPCADDAVCLQKLGAAAGAEYVLTLTAAKNLAEVQCAVFDVGIGQVAASAAVPVADGTADPLGDAVRSCAIGVFTNGQDRARGTLDIKTIPSAATLRIDGLPTGTSPSSRPLFSGSHQVEASRPYFQPATARLDLEEGAVMPLTLTLVPAPWSRGERATHALRWGFLGAGVAAVAAGIALLTYQWPLELGTDPLMQVNTQVGGTVLTSLGAAALVSAGILFALDGHSVAVRRVQ